MFEELGFGEVDAQNIEKSDYNWSLKFADKHRVVQNWKNGKFVNIYRNKAMSSYANLNRTSYISNPRLMDRLIDGEFLPQDVAFMKHYSMYPEKWKESIDRKTQKDEHVFEERPAAMTDQYKCGKCKKRECIFQEKQIRSCDEPMTLFITCTNCGNRWRQ
jgi:transcription elongation factor S-II